MKCFQFFFLKLSLETSLFFSLYFPSPISLFMHVSFSLVHRVDTLIQFFLAVFTLFNLLVLLPQVDAVPCDVYDDDDDG